MRACTEAFLSTPRRHVTSLGMGTALAVISWPGTKGAKVGDRSTGAYKTKLLFLTYVPRFLTQGSRI